MYVYNYKYYLGIITIISPTLLQEHRYLSISLTLNNSILFVGSETPCASPTPWLYIFQIIIFGSTTLLTAGLAGISFHTQWSLTSQSHGSFSQIEQLFFVRDQTPCPIEASFHGAASDFSFAWQCLSKRTIGFSVRIKLHALIRLGASPPS
jgi:hypothetical protein